MSGHDPEPVPEPVVPQRLVVVLPTTGEHDSRTYRIARACAARGHRVTVLARSGPGLPAEAIDPSGYRIVRVAVDPVDGLPVPNLWGPIARRLRGRRGAGTASTARGATADDTESSASPEPGRPPATETAARLRLRLGSALGGAVRMTAIGLTVRAQLRASRAVDPGADLYHGMAYMGIPVALGLAARAGARVVYDARDIYVDAGNLARLPGPVRRVVGRRERGWARRADRVATVNRPYAEVMASRWEVPLPLIVMNCAYRYEPATPRVRRFHERLGLDEAATVVLYQGGYARDRGIEQLIATVPSIAGAVLVLMGYGPLRAELERIAADQAAGGRVHVLPPVPPAELLDWVAAADIVAMPIQPTTLNHRLTTPNKLFEAMAAGVAVVASDLPGMATIVRDSGAGVLVDPTDPASIAAAIGALVADPAERARMAVRGLEAAHAEYHWEGQVEVLLDEYSRLTGRRW